MPAGQERDEGQPDQVPLADHEAAELLLDGERDLTEALGRHLRRFPAAGY